MRSSIETKEKEKPSKVSASVGESGAENADAKGYGGFQSSNRQDEWLLKYEVNEKGVGRILLPPSLSILLQSDRVYITPSAGGLFIRSV
jgi:hypothetical protein